MKTEISRTRVAGAFASAARVALGILWLGEGITKYRAGFGAADIALVAQSAASNPRVPDFYKPFAEHVLGGLTGLFGFGMPLLETGFGVAFILGILTLPAAAGSVATLMMYWLADQLIGQYPIMVALSAVILVWPRASRYYGVTSLAARVLGRRASTDARTVGVLSSLWA